MIVRTAKAYDRDKILDALGGHATVERFMGRTLYLDDEGQALMPIDDNVFVRGPAPEVKALLNLPTAPEEAKGRWTKRWSWRPGNIRSRPPSIL